MVYKSGPIFLPFVTIHACDGQTEFSSLDRVCIPCSAVKNYFKFLTTPSCLYAYTCNSL